MVTPLKVVLVAVLLFGCGDSEDADGGKGKGKPEAQPTILHDTLRHVIYDTVHVEKIATVYDTVERYDTVRALTVVLDTIRTVHRETLRTVVWDTLRTIVTDTLRVEGDVDSKELASVPETKQKPLPLIGTDGLLTGQVSSDALGIMRGSTPAFLTVSAGKLDSLQLGFIAAAFDSPVQHIEKFRWGESMGHGHHFLSAWIIDHGLTVIQLDSAGTVIGSGPPH